MQEYSFYDVRGLVIRGGLDGAIAPLSTHALAPVVHTNERI
jgi:hypothetical protein